MQLFHPSRKRPYSADDIQASIDRLASGQRVLCSRTAMAEAIVVAAVRVWEKTGDPDIVRQIESLAQTTEPAEATA